MKSLFALLITVCFLTSANLTEAQSAAVRNKINQKWNQVQRWQNKQDARFDSIEREAKSLLGKQRSSSSPCPQANGKKKKDTITSHNID
ncbi:MAG: hypothetical protein V1897_00835 [Pseudomonadota bacterium]